jgi:hypothetical protein
MEARHSAEPGPILIKGVLLHCQRGECLRSLENWAERWKWSKGRVRRFLMDLQTESLVIVNDERITTRLTVRDYDTYSKPRNADDTAGGTQNGTHAIPQTGSHAERTRYTTEKGIGDNGEKKGIAVTSPAVNRQAPAEWPFRPKEPLPDGEDVCCADGCEVTDGRNLYRRFIGARRVWVCANHLDAFNEAFKVKVGYPVLVSSEKATA